MLREISEIDERPIEQIERLVIPPGFSERSSQGDSGARHRDSIARLTRQLDRRDEVHLGDLDTAGADGGLAGTLMNIHELYLVERDLRGLVQQANCLIVRGQDDSPVRGSLQCDT